MSATCVRGAFINGKIIEDFVFFFIKISKSRKNLYCNCGSSSLGILNVTLKSDYTLGGPI